MNLFLHGHATHPDVRMAVSLVATQIEAQRQLPGYAQAPTLGWVYLTDQCTAQADVLLAELHKRWPGVEWVGATGVGVSACGVEYFDTPAISLMMTDMPRDQFRVFSGAQPLADFPANTAQVHTDPRTADVAELVHDMSARTGTGYLFGGVASGRTGARHIANSVLSGGLSGVAFGSGVAVMSRVTQGCQPAGPLRTITAAQRNIITGLDGDPALDCLLRDAGLEGAEPRAALQRLRQYLVGLSDAPNVARTYTRRRTPDAYDGINRRGAFGADTRVRHLIGLDSAQHGIAIGDEVEPGMQLTFCTRNVEAARRDLVRICAELREALDPDSGTQSDTFTEDEADAKPPAAGGASRGIAGAVYVSCVWRGGPHFGTPSAELAVVKRALGDIPLVGFFAAGEIARANVYGYTGVLTVFPA